VRTARRPPARFFLLLALAVTGLAVAPGSALGHRVALGAYIPEVGWHPSRIDRYSRQVGHSPVIVSDYSQWDSPAFDRRQLRAVWRSGAVPMITWEPLSYHGRSYPLRAIAHGRYDDYLRRSARTAQAWGHPILLRFAHEMNGNWYPWGLGVNGNAAHTYKSAWRHVVRIFRHEGASNVKWVWCPNVNQAGRVPFTDLYPGDAWVDWVGLDGFNWGYAGSYYSFSQIFGHSYQTLAKLSRRPMIIAETGAGEPNKAGWISQTLGEQLPRFGRIRALVWFNQWSNGVNLRFDSPPAALRAFRSAAAARLYQTNRNRFLFGYGGGG
jgi:hypothetical protein